MQELRAACAEVARRARQVAVEEPAIPAYAAGLPLGSAETATTEPAAGEAVGTAADREAAAAFWLTLDAINFGSGWFPTLRKRPGSSGYNTIATGVRQRFARHGPWSPVQLQELTAVELADVLRQDPGHQLIGLFAGSLNDLGRHVATEFGGSFVAVIDEASDSAVRLVRTLAAWDCFNDICRYEELSLPFLKRAQIAAADVHRAGIAAFPDIGELTMFADNLVPHVLRLDGILRFAPALVERIDRGELIEHKTPEEVEIRACAVHAVELIVSSRPGTTAMEVDELLWQRGAQARYKGSPRHRCRCTAY